MNDIIPFRRHVYEFPADIRPKQARVNGSPAQCSIHAGAQKADSYQSVQLSVRRLGAHARPLPFRFLASAPPTPFANKDEQAQSRRHPAARRIASCLAAGLGLCGTCRPGPDCLLRLQHAGAIHEQFQSLERQQWHQRRQLFIHRKPHRGCRRQRRGQRLSEHRHDRRVQKRQLGLPTNGATVLLSVLLMATGKPAATRRSSAC